MVFKAADSVKKAHFRSPTVFTGKSAHEANDNGSLDKY